MAITKNNRPYSAGKYAMEIAGTHAGWIKEVDGGHASAEVVSEKIGTSVLQFKHLGPLKYEEITFKCGAGMSTNLNEWVQKSFKNEHEYKDGAIISADYNATEIGRLNFTHALVTEFGMPALDASSKDACLMTIKFRPEATQRINGGAGKVSSPIKADRQKQWLPSNFKLQLDGLENSCRHVNKIEALTIKQKVTEVPIGEKRIYQIVPTSVEIPNLVVTFSEQEAEDFYAWHKLFVIDGKCEEKNEKGGQLVYLPPDMDESKFLFRLKFHNLGIFKLTPDKVEAGAEGIRRLKAEMYCENIEYEFNKAYTY